MVRFPSASKSDNTRAASLHFLTRKREHYDAEVTALVKYLWYNDLTPPEFPTLNGDRDTDVLIIGGGMAGILCALRLREAGIDHILLEAKRIGSGITKGTTAVLTAQHDTLYYDMIKSFGRQRSRQYLYANLKAVDRFRALSARFPCDFEDKPSVMYTTGDPDRLRREAKAVRSLGFDAEFTTDVPLPFPVTGAVSYPGMAQFHPLKFLYSVSRGLNIYENTFVRKIKGRTAITDHGNIRAKKIIIASHFPFINRHGLYFMKLYQQRSYIIALEGAPDLGCTVDNADEDGVYMRNYKDLLIIGAGTHRTGKRGGFETVRRFAKQYFPGAKERFAWANQDCVSLDGVPYIGRYSPGMPDVYVASGFNLWGMTTSMIAAGILCDMVQGKKNDYADVFPPDRSILHGQLFCNAGETVLDLATPTVKRCPHMGCALKWNPAEGSWDCPCHGSRFDADGRLKEGPAMHGIGKKK